MSNYYQPTPEQYMQMYAGYQMGAQGDANNASGANAASAGAAGAASNAQQPKECRSLYVGNLDAKVTDVLLWEIFSTIGSVESCKVIKDKMYGESSGYGFVDFYTHEEASRALNNLNGRIIYNKDIKVNWAFAGSNREDTTSHHHIFVGDLSPDIDDDALYKAFQPFGTISDARVMWDQNTGRSRGYGFVAFRDKADAERAMTGMNGEWLGSRAIRCNWANQKVSAGNAISVVPGSLNSGLNYDAIAAQSSVMNTTVYVGNLSPEVSEDVLISIFNIYGPIEEVRIQKDKGFAFVKFANHDQATRAIIAVHGSVIGTRPVKCSWGKERNGASTGTPTVTAPPSVGVSFPPQAYPPMYAAPPNYPYYSNDPNLLYYPQSYPPEYYGEYGSYQ